MTNRSDPTAFLDQLPPEGGEGGEPAAPPAPPAAEATPPVPPVPPAPETDPRDVQTIEGIPVAKYMEMKHREREAQRQIAELNRQLQQRQRREAQPQEVPDPLTDPQAFVEHIQRLNQGAGQGHQQALQEQRYMMSEMMARMAHGPELVEAAIEAFETFPEGNDKRLLWQAFNQNPHPWDAMVKWHKQQQLLSQLGDDPDAYVLRRYAELQAEGKLQPGQPAAPAAPRAPSPPRPGTPFNGGPKKAPPPSLSNAPPSARRTDAVVTGPGASFDSVFKD